MAEPEIPKPELIDSGRYFRLLRQGSSFVLIEPTLTGLETILRWHWNLQDRSPEGFSDLMRSFLELQGIHVLTPSQRSEWGFMTVSDILAWEDDCYLLPGDVNGITAFQKLGREWFLECPCIYTWKDEAKDVAN